MGLFGKSEEEKKEEELRKLKKEQEKIKEALGVLGVDFDSAADEELKDNNKKNVLAIRAGMPSNSFSEILVGASLKSYERLSLMKLADITNQNWILIRQNELIARYLGKIYDALKKQG